MLDAGKALRPTGSTYDPVEQANVDTYANLFDSLCKIQARNVMAQDEESGGRTATTIRLELHLPVATPPLKVDDVWEMTYADPLSAVPVGRRYRVRAPVEKTYPTARRYEVEVVVS
ncbi:MAG: hypothetical protein H0X12_04935 [Nocardioides sp.]|nr:hypothetical protein [Nocardioides sp.]